MRKKLSPAPMVRQDTRLPRPLVADGARRFAIPTAAMLKLALAASVVSGALLTGCGSEGSDPEISADSIQIRSSMRRRIPDTDEGGPVTKGGPGVSPNIEPDPKDVDGEIASVKPVPVPTTKPTPPPIGTVPTLGGAVAPVKPHIPPSPTTPKLAGKIAPTHPTI